MAMEYPITDKRGRRYRLVITLEDERVIYLRLHALSWLLKPRLAGYANLIWQAGRLNLSDIHVEEPYRGQGVGSAVLRIIIDLAQERSARGIDGEVTQGDLEATPDLLSWYERHGFTVTRIAPGTHPSDQRRIAHAPDNALARLRAKKGMTEGNTFRIALLSLDLPLVPNSKRDGERT